MITNFFGELKENKMVFNKDVLFVHIGKTGGISCATYLCNTLHPPVIATAPFRNKNAQKFGYEILINGKRHETLEEANELLSDYGMSVSSFKKVIAVIRNPYDLEISLWNYYNKRFKRGLLREKGRVNAVKRGDFSFFVNQNFLHRPNLKIIDYLTLNNVLYKEIEIIKFENFIISLPEAVKEFQKLDHDFKFPHKNKSQKIITRNDLTDDLKKLIYNKNKWVFEQGFYDKEF